MSSVVTKDSRRHAMARVRWGILSTSRFAQTKVLPAWRRAEHVELAAIASRDLAQAQAVAAEHGIPRAYGSYDELLADPEVFVVALQPWPPRSFTADVPLRAPSSQTHRLRRA
jgi:hypothetical protein